MSGLLFAAAVVAIVVPAANIRMAEMVNADYPAVLERAGQQGAVVLRVVVDPDGRAISCNAVPIIGDPLFGNAACKSSRRWRLDRPQGSDGEPIHALIQPITTFQTDGGGPMMGKIEPAADMQLRASGIRQKERLLLRVQIGADGRMQHCGNPEREGDPLVVAACGVAVAADWDLIQDGHGIAVPYVRFLNVQFDPDAVDQPSAPGPGGAQPG